MHYLLAGENACVADILMEPAVYQRKFVGQQRRCYGSSEPPHKEKKLQKLRHKSQKPEEKSENYRSYDIQVEATT